MIELSRNVRVNRILASKKYQECYQRIEVCEKERIFCRHNMVHFMDVARLAQMENLRYEHGISQEMIYTAALLHDIGRYEQYEEGTPHELASLPLAEEIMTACGYSGEEREMVLDAIRNHRNAQVKGQPTLAGLIYDADKASRLCFCCQAQEACHKKDEKKRLEL